MRPTWQPHERRWRAHRAQRFAGQRLRVPERAQRSRVMPAIARNPQRAGNGMEYANGESAKYRPDFASIEDAIRELAAWRFREED